MVKLSGNINKNMFYGANAKIFFKAKKLRDEMTDAEAKLWEVLRNKHILELRFRRQHPIKQFIVDFYCHEIKLVIEVDGDIHLKSQIQEHDKGREFELEKLGLKVIRFTNSQVLSNIALVKSMIEAECVRLINPCPLKGNATNNIGSESPL
jgi:very-short-patch-repair endonuclease